MSERTSAPFRCPDCSTEVGPGLLSCPVCRRLVHSDELKRLAGEAARASETGNLSVELAAWRRMLELLPKDARQHEVVREKIDGLGRRVDAGEGPKPERPKWAARAAGLGAVGLFVWKFKAVLAFLATKGKLLLLGLTKAGTFFSMLLSIGVYWQFLGWKFALGLVGSIYIHEMGHVAMLRRYGIRASAPMFVPGLGAFVRMNQYPANPREEARVGLAGPFWGLAAAAASAVAFWATEVPAWGVIAKVGAWINLLNLTPVWQLDGNRGFRSLTRPHRWFCVLALAAAWVATVEMTLLLPLAFAVVRAMSRKAPAERDTVGLVQYVTLVVALSALLLIDVAIPVPGGE